MTGRITGKCPKCGIEVDTETSPRTWVASANFGLFCTREHYEEYKRDIGIYNGSEQPSLSKETQN